MILCKYNTTVICGSILVYYSDLQSSKPEIMLICGDLWFLGRSHITEQLQQLGEVCRCSVV